MGRPSDRRSWEIRRLPHALLALGLIASAVGCAEEERAVYRETTRVDESVKKSDLLVLRSVLQSLTPTQLASLPAVFASAPSWSADRTLPVRELVAEEVRRQADEGSLAIVTRRFPRSKAFDRLVEAGRRTPEQIVSLYIAASWALARAEIADERLLDEYYRRAETELGSLRLDDRPFGPLPSEVRFGIEQRAAWLSVIDRVERLRLIPPENVETVAALGEEFAALFPASCRQDPVTAVLPRLELFGVPFEEPDPSRSDADLVWRAETALIGRDGTSTN
ncbi:MAG: hypothetical protein AAGJ97_03200 [Planctomycetota bacterium]